MRKLLVHCGMPKTGTSIAQYFFNKLGEEGVINYFPEYKRGIAHHQLANEIIERKSSLFVESVRKSLDDISLISSENLSNGFGKKIEGLELVHERLSDCVSLEFIVVLRRMDYFLDSMYCQQVRFGKYSGDISEYVLSRKKWIDNFFGGLGKAKYVMGSNLVLPIHGPDFNVISFFADKLSFDKSRISGVLSGAPDTSKFSYKSQVILNNLEMFNDKYNVRIDRSDMVSALSSGGVKLDGDTSSYTFVDMETATGVLNAALESAEKYNVTEYLEAFSDMGGMLRKIKALPMRFDVVTSSDAECVIDYLRRNNKEVFLSPS